VELLDFYEFQKRVFLLGLWEILGLRSDKSSVGIVSGLETVNKRIHLASRLLIDAAMKEGGGVTQQRGKKRKRKVKWTRKYRNIYMRNKIKLCELGVNLDFALEGRGLTFLLGKIRPVGSSVPDP
jgi:hypothetical protein